MKSPFTALFLFLFLASSYLQAQSAKWDWVNNGPVGTNEGPHFLGSVIDASGNSYVCGSFIDTVKIGNGTKTNILYSNGGEDIFIAKYDSKGNMIWVKSAGTHSDDYAINVTLDKKGHIYVAGDFDGASQPGTKLNFGSGISISSDTTDFSFLACYDTSGLIKWAIASSHYNSYMTTDSAGDCLLTGAIFNSNSGGNGYLSSVFLDIYDTLGNILFSDSYPSDGQDASGNWVATGTAVSWDIHHNFYLAGVFSHDITINGRVHYANTLKNYQTCGFLIKYNANHIIQWVKYFEEKDGDADAYGFGTDRNGNIYLSGDYSSIFNSSSFLNADGTLLGISDSLWNHIYLSSFDSSGKMLWIKDVCRNHQREFSFLCSTTDSNGNTYISNSFSDTVKFGTTSLISQGNEDVFVAKYNNYGVAKWAIDGGSTCVDAGECISSNSAGGVNIIGLWGGGCYNASFGNISITKESTYLSYFFAQLSQDTSTGIMSTANNISLHIYPNPSHNTFNIQEQNQNSGESEVCLTDIVGHQVARFSIKDKNNFTINAADYSMKSGVYILSIQSGNSIYTGKLVVE